MAPGALPRPGRVPEQRLLSPEIYRRRWRRCGTLLEISPILLGFSVPSLYIGEETVSGGRPGGLTMGGLARVWAAPPFCVGSPWPLFGSRLVLVLYSGKIGVPELVSSNSENISCVAFLKHKNSRKQGTGTVVSCQ
jgi:hypothetical protein